MNFPCHRPWSCRCVRKSGRQIDFKYSCYESFASHGMWLAVFEPYHAEPDAARPCGASDIRDAQKGIPHRAKLDAARPCEASDIRDARKGMLLCLLIQKFFIPFNIKPHKIPSISGCRELVKSNIPEFIRNVDVFPIFADDIQRSVMFF